MRKRLHPLTAALAVLAACTPSDDGSQRRTDARGSATIAVHPSQRAVLRAVGSDTLSDSARVLRVLPEPDGNAVTFLFADPASRVSAGLAITGGAADGTQLLWPDSVVSFWWSAPHQLTFATRTGAGARVVVDVHAAKLSILEQRRVTPPPPSSDSAVPAEVRARAQDYVDSLHTQPGGAAAQGSALRYQVDRITLDPSGQLAAFHVVALDQSGRRSNPAWYALAVPRGGVARIDGIIGDARDLPEEAGGWTADQRFIFAKGLTLWDAHVAAGQ